MKKHPKADEKRKNLWPALPFFVKSGYNTSIKYNKKNGRAYGTEEGRGPERQRKDRTGSLPVTAGAYTGAAGAYPDRDPAEDAGKRTGGGGGGAYSNNMYIPYWTEERPSNKYPAANFSGDGRFKGLQSRAFVRLQDITLSYTFNSAKIKNFGINNLRVFFTGKNLFTITGWENGDPELGNTILSSTYPISTNLSLGANISF